MAEEKKLNIFAKLAAVRSEFYEAGAKKTGMNPHAEFMYFELEDIVPIAENLFKKYNLFLITTFVEGQAKAQIVDIDEPDSGVVSFEIPIVLISEPGKFRMNEVQGVGAAVTYYRRYLYMIVLDLVEADEIDNQNGDENLAETPVSLPEPAPAPKKPVSTEERKAIKEKLTSEDTNADETMILELRKQLKSLMDHDPDQEEFVQSAAEKTKGFTAISKSQCADLIEGVKGMIAVYEEQKKQESEEELPL